MIYGVGNDLLDIDRMRKSLKNPRFSLFCFSAAEREAYDGDAVKLAGCFAAKEALSKALRTGVRGFTLDEITVLRDEMGAPYIEFEGAIGDIVQLRRLTAHLALTNTDRYVLATVVLEVQP